MTVKEYLLSIIQDHPHDAVKMAMDKFGFTRMAVHYHMKKLIKEGAVKLKGRRNKATYHLARPLKIISKDSKDDSLVVDKFYTIGERSESEIWKQDIEHFFKSVPENIFKICRHGFTEIFNNVIDHSEGEVASVELERTSKEITINISDNGIGIYKKVAMACGFTDYREAIVKIHQGKFTTDRSKHSGEGIFFTSRIFDRFCIIANGLAYIKDNSEDDWHFERRDAKDQRGTFVYMTISLSAKREIQDIFNMFTDKESYKFDKSHIRVSLAQFEEDEFVSRSQAKRILHNLGKFREIILDFTNVKSVGQAFVDEVFGVFALENPHVEFIVTHASSDVGFMIRRGVANRDNSNLKIKFIE